MRHSVPDRGGASRPVRGGLTLVELRSRRDGFMLVELRNRRGGFTLVELLVATALALIILGITTYMFGSVTKAVNEQRSAIEIRMQLRSVTNQLRQDLLGCTIVPNPPHNPAKQEGYFEYVEGPYGAAYDPRYRLPANTSLSKTVPYLWNDTARPTYSGGGSLQYPDDTVGDADDILMFTSRNMKNRFKGRQTASGGGKAIRDSDLEGQSPEAEIIYFVRGTTLHRRVLLIGTLQPNGLIDVQGAPDTSSLPAGQKAGLADYPLQILSPADPRTPTEDSIYMSYDFSIREERIRGINLTKINTLEDLADRRHRFGHQPLRFPFDVRGWGPLGMPTIGECSSPAWKFPEARAKGGITFADNTLTDGEWWANLPNQTSFDRGLGRNADPLGFDPRLNPIPWNSAANGTFGGINGQTGQMNSFANDTPTSGNSTMAHWGDQNRHGEDVVLTNVLSFDVKAWDPQAPVFVENNATVNQGDPRYFGLFSGTTPPAALGDYVDLHYNPGFNTSRTSWFSGPGDAKSFLHARQIGSGSSAFWLPAIYDSFTTGYESDGVNQANNVSGVNAVDEASNGIDDNGVGGVDDPSERETAPPYARPLRGIQIKIRIFEPSTQEIREMTVVHEFARE